MFASRGSVVIKGLHKLMLNKVRLKNVNFTKKNKCLEKVLRNGFFGVSIFTCQRRAARSSTWILLGTRSTLEDKSEGENM